MFHKDLQKYAFYDRLELCIDPTHAGNLLKVRLPVVELLYAWAISFGTPPLDKWAHFPRWLVDWRKSSGSLANQEMYDLDLAQFDKIAVTLDKFKIGVEGASGVWVVAWMF